MARSGYRPSPTDTTYPDGIGITDRCRFYTTSRDTTKLLVVSDAHLGLKAAIAKVLKAT